ncbi:MAG: hypothetical protein HQL86_03685 [Magnetococcales bacterium]|nr:hypothetical protein [Magnetococcales bacterium]
MMKAHFFGMPLLVLDLMFGMLFLLLILIIALPQPRPPEPPEAEARRLRAENTELSARLLAQEGNIPNANPATSAGREGGRSPLPAPSAAAEASGLTLLRAEVAELTARNESLQHALAARDAGKSVGGKPAATESTGEQDPHMKPVENQVSAKEKESLLAGREARIKQLQTEVFRLFTLVEDSSREAGEARQARVTLEAQLKQREARLAELNQEIDAMAARTPGLAQSQTFFDSESRPISTNSSPQAAVTAAPPPKPGGNPHSDATRPAARRFEGSAPPPPVAKQP